MANKLKKHTLDESHFDVIDTPEKAYWMGFLLADGCVRTGKNTLTVNLKMSDIEHLCKLVRQLSGSHVPNLHKQGSHPNPIASVTFTSTHMTDALRSHGLVANAKQPMRLPPEIERHYWRGVVDGDGTIVISAQKRKNESTCNQMTLSICGTKETAELFGDFARRITGTEAEPKKRSEKLWTFGLHGPIALSLATELYGDATVYLDRKMARFIEYAPLCGRREIIIKPLVHGTRRGYVSLGCRCELCRKAGSAAWLAWSKTGNRRRNGRLIKRRSNLTKLGYHDGKPD
jgi:hypothetical protein